MTVDSSRRPVAVGYTQSDAGDADFALARFKWDGTLDPSFGVGGKVTTDFGTDGDYANSMAIDARGRIVVGGGGPPSSRCGSCNGFAPGFELARYEPDGTLDPSFGVGGKVTTHFGARSGLNSIAIDRRGRIVAAGFAANHAFALARYGPSGTSTEGSRTMARSRAPCATSTAAPGSSGSTLGGNRRRRRRWRDVLPDRSLQAERKPRPLVRPGGQGEDRVREHSVWSAAIDSRDRIVVAAGHAEGVLARFVGYRWR